MQYLKSFTLPTDADELEYLLPSKPGKLTKLDMQCYASNQYPFGIFPHKRLSKIEFEPITIFYGGNGSGKSTTEKMICGLIPTSGGSIKLYGKDYADESVRAKMGVLIEAPGCFPGLTVFDNMMLQASNLSIQNAEQEVVKVLKMVRMEGAAGGMLFAFGLGAISKVVLKKTSLV